jgi:hypothetical protein
MANPAVQLTPLKIYYSGIHHCYVLRSDASHIVLRTFSHEADALMCSIHLKCYFHWKEPTNLNRIYNY